MAQGLSKFLQNQNDTKIFCLTSCTSLLIWLNSALWLKSRSKSKKKLELVIGQEKNGTTNKIQVDGKFFSSLRKLLRVLVPGPVSKESGYMALIALMLVLRSICDIWMINNGTLIESAIISKNRQTFIKYLVDLFLAMPTISLVNNLLKFGLSSLKLRFRARLSSHLYINYLKGFTYYKMNNLDNRITNADQLLTQDVDKFCDSVVDLYSNISKPILDIAIYVHKLTQTIGAQAPAVMLAYLVFSGSVLTRLRRPLSRLTAEEQRLEGELRYVNSRLITNCEEIAFYNGNRREKTTIDAALSRLIEHLQSAISFRFTMGFVDNIIAKYMATCVGFCVVSYPYLVNSSLSQGDHKHRMEFYYKSGRMLVRLAQAVGRVVLAGRDLTKLAGYTARVEELRTVLADLNSGNYSRTMVAQGSVSGALVGRGSVVIADNLIKFDRVPLATPNGDVLIDELSFEVHSGVNVLVCGPNGCGKSSLFRILGELWPVFGGTVTKPSAGNLFYIPQRPYMTIGTLRDQVIYPDIESVVPDDELLELLARVQLTHIVEREGGWDAVADWMDVLSGGEKQRIAMARVFYHRPQFAILDECTSAVSVDVEDAMYRHCRQLGITLFTVSHRKSLWKHHQYYFHMDGRGSYEFRPIEDDTREFGS
ncbi:ATP-binding cassette sub-family D member 3 isoform X2 [Hyalella azteca]|uniref:ATP-binding cassette sub-family D member 3 isoform X2 n=1 Tax=Hyalella azteca TaxID=294128 RepID=A0A8B7PMT0_HYAAZ|nr:ATP-binding cassette sub-family D member 3 isoform X2 [Hyalella azteca]